LSRAKQKLGEKFTFSKVLSKIVVIPSLINIASKRLIVDTVGFDKPYRVKLPEVIRISYSEMFITRSSATRPLRYGFKVVRIEYDYFGGPLPLFKIL
jgi:hypothetical protein